MISHNKLTRRKAECKDAAVGKIAQMINENAPLILQAIEMSRRDEAKIVTFREAQCLLSYVLSTCDWLQHPEHRGLGELVLEDVLGLDPESAGQVLDELEADGYAGFPVLRLAPRELQAWSLIVRTIQDMNADVKALIQIILDRTRDPIQRERDPGYRGVITAELLEAKTRSMRRALH